ncbi:MAG TPA: DUF4262 domain-containing protein, partial [Dehalococcoidia bacterium]|nr:DUF4262 domain-containing protein [Dehalococcoidia bacterium]
MISNPMQQTIRDNIAKFGWHAQEVFPTPDDPGYPFTYTIGLTDKGHPELIVFGLPGDAAHKVLIAALWKLEHGEVKEGELTDEILRRYPVVFRELPADKAAEDHTFQAAVYYGRPVRFMQIIWPDRAGRFPWHPDCDP